jgi:hypothetical protein
VLGLFPLDDYNKLKLESLVRMAFSAADIQRRGWLLGAEMPLLSEFIADFHLAYDWFKTMDIDGDGHVTLKDYTKYVNDFGIQLKVSVEKKFKQIDLNGDGFITIGEFATHIAGQKIADILKQREKQLAGIDPTFVKNKNASETNINANYKRVDQEMKIMEKEFFEIRSRMA